LDCRILLRLEPAADVLGLGLRVEDVLAHLLELLLELAQPVEVHLAGKIDFSFLGGVFVTHLNNLDKALAVKSTMGTTRA
jgi:hypothetical protein